MMRQELTGRIDGRGGLPRVSRKAGVGRVGGLDKPDRALDSDIATREHLAQDRGMTKEAKLTSRGRRTPSWRGSRQR